MKRAGPACLGITIAMVISGCAWYPHTKKLARYDLSAGYRFDQLSRDARIAKTAAKAAAKKKAALGKTKKPDVRKGKARKPASKKR